MRKSLKIATATAVLLMALGTVAFVYAYSQNNATATANEQQISMQRMQTFFGSDNVTLPGNVTLRCRMNRLPQMQANGLQLTEGLLQNATLSTVDGTVVSTVQGMLVLDTGSGQVRVLLPKDWTLDNEILGRAALFNGTFASPGQSVTVKVLESNVFSNANFSINVMIGYEAINANSTHAYAVLPFNIQPNT